MHGLLLALESLASKVFNLWFGNFALLLLLNLLLFFDLLLVLHYLIALDDIFPGLLILRLIFTFRVVEAELIRWVMQLNRDVVLVVEVRTTAVDDEVAHLHVEDIVGELRYRMVHRRLLHELILGRFCIVNAFELCSQQVELIFEVPRLSLMRE